MSESPKAFLKRRDIGPATRPAKQALERETRSIAAKFLANPQQEGVFFYPRFGTDFLHPLQGFAHACQTFIFCDWGFGNGGNREEATFVQWYEGLRRLAIAPNGMGIIDEWITDTRLDDPIVQALTNMDELVRRFFPNGRNQMPRELNEYLQALNPARARCAKLRVRGIDDNMHNVQAFFFAAEAVNLYFKLFAQNNKAPEFLCVKRWWSINEWTRLNDWNAHLGRVMEVANVFPQYLIAHKLKNGWPYANPVPIRFDWTEPDKPAPQMWVRNQVAAAEKLRDLP